MQRQRCFRTDSHDVETCSKLCAPNEGMSIGSLTNPPVCPHPATGLRATAFPRPIDPDDLRQVDSPGIRTVEIADLEWSQIEWGRNPALHVRRAKKTSSRCCMLHELQRGAGAQLWTIWKTHCRMSRVCCVEPPCFVDTP